MQVAILEYYPYIQNQKWIRYIVQKSTPIDGKIRTKFNILTQPYKRFTLVIFWEYCGAGWCR